MQRSGNIFLAKKAGDDAFSTIFASSWVYLFVALRRERSAKDVSR
jgi:hypothetical protein